MKPVRVDNHGGGAVSSTHERREFVRPVVESVVGVVVEVMEVLDLSVTGPNEMGNIWGCEPQEIPTFVTGSPVQFSEVDNDVPMVESL